MNAATTMATWHHGLSPGSMSCLRPAAVRPPARPCADPISATVPAKPPAHRRQPAQRCVPRPRHCTAPSRLCALRKLVCAALAPHRIRDTSVGLDAHAFELKLRDIAGRQPPRPAGRPVERRDLGLAQRDVGRGDVLLQDRSGAWCRGSARCRRRATAARRVRPAPSCSPRAARPARSAGADRGSARNFPPGSADARAAGR